MQSIDYHTNELINEQPLTRREEKSNYWRGFRACLILIVLPLAILFVIFCDRLTNQLNSEVQTVNGYHNALYGTTLGQ